MIFEDEDPAPKPSKEHPNGGEWEYSIHLKDGVAWRDVLPLEDETPSDAMDLLGALDRGELELWASRDCVRLYTQDGRVVLEIPSLLFQGLIDGDPRGQRRRRPRKPRPGDTP